MLDLKGYCQRLGLDWDVEDGEDDKPALSAEEDEELSCSFADVELAVGEDGTSAGQGTVYITTRRLIWVGDANSSGSIACHYRQISMHAVARDTEAFSRPCVYIQLDEGSEVMQDNDDEEEEEEQLSAELRLVPQDEVQVEAIFSKLCECSALNPDTDAEEEAGAQLFFDEAEVLAGLPDDQRAALLAARAEGALELQDGHDELEELMADNPERFEDDEAGGEGEDEPAGNGHAS